MNHFDIGRLAESHNFLSRFGSLLVSGLSPRCDPLTLVPLRDHKLKRDWHLIGICLTYLVVQP